MTDLCKEKAPSQESDRANEVTDSSIVQIDDADALDPVGFGSIPQHLTTPGEAAAVLNDLICRIMMPLPEVNDDDPESRKAFAAAKKTRKAWRNDLIKSLVDCGRLDAQRARAMLSAITDVVMRSETLAPHERDDEPWPDEVDLRDVIKEIESLAGKVLYASPSVFKVLAYWIAFTWMQGQEIAPYLLITSVARQCGKSTMTELLVRLCRRPWSTCKPTASALFREIDRCHPTVILDECDEFLERDSELNGILNAGYKRNGTEYVVRTEKTPNGSFRTERFNVFCPKSFSGIGINRKFSSALVDRCIAIEIERRPKDGPELMKLRSIPQETFQVIRAKLARAAEDVEDDLHRATPFIPEELSDRAGEVWEPLLALADILGEGDEMRRIAVTAYKEAPASSDYREDLLNDIRDVLAEIDASPTRSSFTFRFNAMAKEINIPIVEYGDRQYIVAARLHEYLISNPELRWSDFGTGGRPLTLNTLTRLLDKDGGFGVATNRIREDGRNGRRRAYQVDGKGGLREVIARYGGRSDQC